MKTRDQIGFVTLSLLTGMISGAARADRFTSPQVFKLQQNHQERKVSAGDKTQADYWRETGLTVQNYFDDVTDHCYDSLRSFRGCYEGLSDVAGALKEGVILGTPRDVKAGQPTLGAVAETLAPGLNLYQPKKVEVKDRLELRDLRNKMRAIHQATTEELFKTGPRIDFKGLISSLIPRALVGENATNEALFAATLYNEYLGATDDPHSRLSPTQEEIQDMHAEDQRFYGIGVQTRISKGKLSVYQVYHNSPAEKYGVHRNDEITAVNETPVTGLDDAKISQLIRGPENTQVTLTVKRKGQELKVPITRGVVITKNIDSRIVTDAGTKIGYIKFKDFMDEKGSEKVRAMIESLESNGAQALILDLRGNLGGLLNQAFEISEFFVGAKPILSVMTLSTQVSRTYRGSNAPITRLPLAVLIDANSASASEITAGAIQDNNRGWIVGERSFGKGTVQTVARYPFKSYNRDRLIFDVMDPKANIRYRKTFQRFYQPSGRTNQIQGIIPSFAVDPFPQATAADKFRFREEDYYDNALPAIERPWVESRLNQVSEINRCRDTNGADQWYQAAMDSDVGLDAPDYRLYAAEDILRCDIKTSATMMTSLFE